MRNRTLLQILIGTVTVWAYVFALHVALRVKVLDSPCFGYECDQEFMASVNALYLAAFYLPALLLIVATEIALYMHWPRKAEKE